MIFFEKECKIITRGINMNLWQKFSRYFDDNTSKIIWILLGIQTLIIAILSFPN
ncbi:hypothetical protein AEBR_1905 [Halarcobacter ebronensis]|nr:hypothetical protein AEBR_1905 [Halarcobacter ebronensis]